jgi:hypothetical protein
VCHLGEVHRVLTRHATGPMHSGHPRHMAESLMGHVDFGLVVQLAVLCLSEDRSLVLLLGV